jgi:hypothetical protein
VGFRPTGKGGDVKDRSGLEFYDATTRRTMKYMYPDTDHWTAGWLLYKHPDGQWVTYRKATDADIASMNEAVVKAHHFPTEKA